MTLAWPFLPKVRNRLSGLRVEREQKRSGRRCRRRRRRSRRRGCGRRSPPARPPPIRFVTSKVHSRWPSAALTRVDAAARIGHVHHAVHDHRRRLIADAVDDAVLKQPSRRQRLDVGRVDLIHRRDTGCRPDRDCAAASSPSSPRRLAARPARRQREDDNAPTAQECPDSDRSYAHDRPHFVGQTVAVIKSICQRKRLSLQKMP